ncbi:MAG: D-alanyl-D-alanine carboxypeptidase family protein [Lachnospiraceae bacterium]
MKKITWKHKKRFLAAVLCMLSAGVIQLNPVLATDTTTAASQTQTVPKSNFELAEERKSEKVASNQRKGWPKGPAIGAEGACLMDADTGAILYDKNMDEQLYPASVTKIMTGLLAVENSDMKETVKFSANAINSVPWDGANMGMRVGEKLTMEQCLNGVLVHSANEVANGVAEHVAGSMPKFADMMNARAKELGCKNTHFVNANGLFDENHYTSAHDLALIGQAFFSHKELCEMASKSSYTVKKTNKRPEGFTVYSKNKFFNGQYTYDTVIGSKTGFTSEARQTLVTCAERDGRKLICVILKEESPAQFEDTMQLFDYGFNEFQNYSIEQAGSVEGLLGDSNEPDAVCSIEIEQTDAKFTLPKNVKPQSVGMKWKKGDTTDNSTSQKEETVTTGEVLYKYLGQVVGKVEVTKTSQKEITKSAPSGQLETPNAADSLIKRIMQKTGQTDPVLVVAMLAAVVILAIMGISVIIWAVIKLTQQKKRRRKY